jgi:hypothetical protein
MNLDGFALHWMIICVVLISFMGILFMRSADRFWLPCITVWLFLFFLGITGVVLNSNEISYQKQLEALRADETVDEENPEKQPYEIEQAQVKQTNFTRKFAHTLGAQTLFTLFWVLIGYKVTGLRYYRKAAITFSLLSLLYFLWIVL